MPYKTVGGALRRFVDKLNVILSYLPAKVATALRLGKELLATAGFHG
jgi:hypothetical protein